MKDERLVFTCGSDLLVVCSVLLNFVYVSRTSETMFEIRCGDETRDAFVEPEVIPVAAGDHVSPPLVCKLVRREPHCLFVLQHLVAVGFPQRRETAHFLRHTAGRQHLRVSSIDVLHTRTIFEEVEHAGCLAKDAAQLLVSMFGCEVLKLNVSSFLLHDLKRTSREAKDVSRNGGALVPLGDAFIVRQRAL